MRTALLMLVGVFYSATSLAQTEADWKTYNQTFRYECPGPFADMAAPQEIVLGDKTYILSGYRLRIKDKDADKRIVFGVLGAIKGGSKNIISNIQQSLTWFEQEGVEWIVVNGDLIHDPIDADDVFDALGSTSIPVLVLVGNSDSLGVYVKVFDKASAKYPNLVNGVLVRQLVLDDAELWTLPGYYDRRYLYSTGGCVYDDDDIAQMYKRLHPMSLDPVVLVAHGPPKTRGSIDRVYSGMHVGDERMAKMIEHFKIPFGILGHILESGGSAVGTDFGSSVGAETWSEGLYLNVGSASSDPWKMRSGVLSFGMAAVMRIEDRKAQYLVKKFKAPEEDAGIQIDPE